MGLRYFPNCLCCGKATNDCPICCENLGGLPLEITLHLTGIADGTTVTFNCTDLDGDYLIDMEPDTGTYHCSHSYNFNKSPTYVCIGGNLNAPPSPACRYSGCYESNEITWDVGKTAYFHLLAAICTDSILFTECHLKVVAHFDDLTGGIDGDRRWTKKLGSSCNYDHEAMTPEIFNFESSPCLLAGLDVSFSM